MRVIKPQISERPGGKLRCSIVVNEITAGVTMAGRKHSRRLTGTVRRMPVAILSTIQEMIGTMALIVNIASISHVYYRSLTKISSSVAYQAIVIVEHP